MLLSSFSACEANGQKLIISSAWKTSGFPEDKQYACIAVVSHEMSTVLASVVELKDDTALCWAREQRRHSPMAKVEVACVLLLSLCIAALAVGRSADLQSSLLPDAWCCLMHSHSPQPAIYERSYSSASWGTYAACQSNLLTWLWFCCQTRRELKMPM